MRLEITSQPGGKHFVVIDGFGRVLDLSGVNGTLHDPTISRATWGMVSLGGDTREGGLIHRSGDPRAQAFFDRAILKPYLDAFALDRDGPRPDPDEPVTLR